MSRWVKIPLYIVGALVGLVALSAAGLYASSSMKISKTYEVPLTEITIPKDSATLARGQHLVEAIGDRVGLVDVAEVPLADLDGGVSLLAHELGDRRCLRGQVVRVARQQH